LGIGYGILRLRDSATTSAGSLLAGRAEPDLGFNYLGRIRRPASTGDTNGTQPTEASSAAWTPAAAHTAATEQFGMRSHPIDLDLVAEETADGPRLVAMWAWDATCFSDQRIRELADAWERAAAALAACARREEAGGRTPTDLDLVVLNQDEIDQLEMEWGK
jgi:non-ribosomal peptide synthase protein (TIGR01720 family)